MKICQLEYFLSIEKYNNFAMAAEENYISQSSLSKQIKALEQELGLELFDRNTRNVKLTEAGTTFSFYAARIVNDCHNMNNALKRHYPSKQRLIKIISIPILTHYGLIEKISEFQKIYPDIIIEASEQHTAAIQRAIKYDEADIYFLRPQHIPDNSEYRMCLLVEDDVSLVVSAKHRLADRHEISLCEASDEMFLLMWYGTSTYTTFMNVCRDSGFIPKTNTSYLSIDSILKMVGNGEGVSLVASKVADYSLNPNLRVIRLKEKYELNTVALIKSSKDPGMLSTFIEYIKLKK